MWDYQSPKVTGYWKEAWLLKFHAKALLHKTYGSTVEFGKTMISFATLLQVLLQKSQSMVRVKTVNLEKARPFLPYVSE